MDKKFFLGLFAVAMMSGVAVSANESVLEEAEVANITTSKEVVQDVQNEAQEDTAEQGCGCGQ